MRVEAACTRHVVTVTPDQSLLEVARAMRHHHVGDVVVVEQSAMGTRPLGIITDRDLVVGVLAQGITDFAALRAGDAIARSLEVVSCEDQLAIVAHRMAQTGVRRLPVVNSLGALVGIVSYDDVLRTLTEQLAHLTEKMTHQHENERVRRASPP